MSRRVSRVYKVVEVGTVTDEELEQVLNLWTARGWSFDGMQFAMRESSRRPAMAFVTFSRDEHADSRDEPADSRDEHADSRDTDTSRRETAPGEEEPGA